MVPIQFTKYTILPMQHFGYQMALAWHKFLYMVKLVKTSCKNWLGVICVVINVTVITINWGVVVIIRGIVTQVWRVIRAHSVGVDYMRWLIKFIQFICMKCFICQKKVLFTARWPQQMCHYTISQTISGVCNACTDRMQNLYTFHHNNWMIRNKNLIATLLTK